MHPVAAPTGLIRSTVPRLVDELSLGHLVRTGMVNRLDVPTIVLRGEIGDLIARITPTVSARLTARGMASEWMPLEVVQDHDDVAGATGGALLHLSRVVATPAAFVAA